jgi:hypothetical protein
MPLHVWVGLPRRDLTPRPQATIEKAGFRQIVATR